MLNGPNDIPSALPVAATNPLPKAAPAKAAAAPAALPAGDTVEISPRAKEAAKLVATLNQLPDVDEGAVQRAQQRVSSVAPAPVAAAQLAEKLLTES
jgi:hypothetical protein